MWLAHDALAALPKDLALSTPTPLFANDDLTKAKLAQVVPVAGAVIGGGFNAYYTDKVCKAAFYLYRERFLAEKYGVDEIEVTVEPATTLQPGYETSHETATLAC